MSFDLRLPVGLMFVIFGLILTGVGLLGGAELPAHSLGININLWWGLAQLVFGAIMLAFGLRGRRLAPSAAAPGRDAAE